MEILTILLSGLLTLVSPAGLVVDRVIANNLRSRFDKVEQLQVRVDNAPSYQLVQGKVERVRIAGRGLWVTPDVRLDVLELETDPINLDLQRLRGGGQQAARESLRQPVQAGLHVALTDSDLNKALQSPAVKARLRLIFTRFLGGSPERYEIINPKVEFLDNKRLRFQVELREKDAQPLALVLESGLGVVAGRSLQLIEPTVLVNGKPLSSTLVAGLTRGLSNRLDLRTLEDAGITARLLQLNVQPGALDVAAFVRVDPSKPQSNPNSQKSRQ
jgi:hypothetical protein